MSDTVMLQNIAAGVDLLLGKQGIAPVNPENETIDLRGKVQKLQDLLAKREDGEGLAHLQDRLTAQGAELNKVTLHRDAVIGTLKEMPDGDKLAKILEQIADLEAAAESAAAQGRADAERITQLENQKADLSAALKVATAPSEAEAEEADTPE